MSPTLTPMEHSALQIVRRLTDKGFQALYAGGYVRDRLLGRGTHGDIDIATSATPEQVSRVFPHVVGVGEHFGVMIVVWDGTPFEVATFRADVGSTDGRHPDSVSFTDARTDAQRRDFTINGMFFDPISEEVLDYVGGREDLSAGIIRAIGEPLLRFGEDYLRLLRAVRFSARFGFPIEPATWSALVAARDGIAQVSQERVFQELDKMLVGAHPDAAIRQLHESGLLALVLPEVEAMVGVEQPAQFHPEGDVFEHTIKALALIEEVDRVIAWSVLLHDIGKPRTQQMSDRIRFNNHQRVGANMSARVLTRLHAPNALIDAVYACVDNHMNFINVQQMKLSTLKKFLARPTFHAELVVHKADCQSSHGDISNYDYLQAKAREMPVDQIKPAPLVGGKDLIALGLTPGPRFGQILSAAYDLQLEEKLTTHEEAVEWVRENHLVGEESRSENREAENPTDPTMPV